jgi:hypothetical protein
MKRLIAIASGLFLLTLVIIFWTRSRQPKPVELVPTLTGQPEYCLTCHSDLPEISPSHPVKTFGCVTCHGGEPLALNADLAHSSMRGGNNPSDFSVVNESCGGSDCHGGDPTDYRDHIQRATTSVQATYAGAIANIRYTFGAQPDLIARFGIRAVQDDHITTSTGLPFLQQFDPTKETNPSIQAFASNCLDCHLYADPLPGQEYQRLTGCAACHSPGPTQSEWSPYSDQTKQTDVTVHTLTTAIPYTQCNTCHNRGNYDLRTITFVPRTDHPTDRLHDYYQPIAQFTRCEWTLDCVDCHTRVEAMGDGDIHSNKSEIQYTQCRTCHGTLEELPKTRTITDENDLALKLAFLNPVIDLKIGDTILVTDQGEALWNIRLLPDGTYELFGKATGERFTFNPVKGTSCLQKPDEQESRYCHECHSVER